MNDKEAHEASLRPTAVNISSTLAISPSHSLHSSENAHSTHAPMDFTQTSHFLLADLGSQARLESCIL